MAHSTAHIDGSYLEGVLFGQTVAFQTGYLLGLNCSVQKAQIRLGGQILRNAAALSCITKVPIQVDKIRAGRSNPGLRPQHLMGLQLLREMSSGVLAGGHVGSTEISLTPKEITGGKYVADTKTAGSICLLLQAALPCQFFASGPSELYLKGGTNADMAPQIDFFMNILQPLLCRSGLQIECDIIRRLHVKKKPVEYEVEKEEGKDYFTSFSCDHDDSLSDNIQENGVNLEKLYQIFQLEHLQQIHHILIGYFPKGGGEAIVRCSPAREIPPIVLTDEGQLVSVSGKAFVAGVLPPKVGHVMAKSAHDVLSQSLGRSVPINIQAVKEPEHKAFGTGCGINIFAETSTGCLLAGSALGKRGVPAEKVGKDAAEELLKSLKLKVCADEYLQDQLIIFMALAKGKSEVKCGPITQHTETGIHVAQSLTQAHFEIKKLSEETNLIICEGVGWQNQQL